MKNSATKSRMPSENIYDNLRTQMALDRLRENLGYIPIVELEKFIDKYAVV